MKYHRSVYGCFGRSPRYAYAWSTSHSSRDSDDLEPDRTAQESRHHSGAPGSGSRRRRSSEFGARRPLRYLSYHLDLDESQRRNIATVLDRLKIEREQSELDEKKTVAEIAGLIGKEGLSVDDLRGALRPRVASSENLQATIAKSIHDIVEILDPDQREEFAFMLRSGAFKASWRDLCLSAPFTEMQRTSLFVLCMRGNIAKT